MLLLMLVQLKFLIKLVMMHAEPKGHTHTSKATFIFDFLCALLRPIFTLWANYLEDVARMHHFHFLGHDSQAGGKEHFFSWKMETEIAAFILKVLSGIIFR